MTGNPDVLVKISNIPVKSEINDQETFDFRNNTIVDGWINVTIPYINRFGNEVDCLTSGFYLLGGNTECAIYITIACDKWCAFNLTINNTDSPKMMPSHLLSEKYLTTTVSFKERKYFYFPIGPKNRGDVAIILKKNKGDAKLFANVIGDTEKGPETWNYPTPLKKLALSYEKNPKINEMIEFCALVTYRDCKTENCAILMGVEGATKDVESEFSMIIYANNTKLNST